MIHPRISAKLMIGVTTVLVAVMGLNLYADVRQQKAQASEDLREQARMVATQLIAMREFMARNQERINYDTEGHFEFKGLNPAAVGRGVGEIFAEMSDYRYKQTRLQVRNPDNQPDALEIEALRRFEADPSLREYEGRTGVNGDSMYRYLVPLKAEASCLQCHGGPKGEIDIAGYPKEGLREGDLAGALSISIPMARVEARLAEAIQRRTITIITFAALSLALIAFLTRQLVARPLAVLAGVTRRIGRGDWEIRDEEVRELRVHHEMALLLDALRAMSNELRTLYQGLEQKVGERTLQLREANERLIKAHENLAQMSKSQTEFYSAMTHEFRTPLTSIIGFTQLLLSPGGQPLTQEQQEYLTDILESARRLLQIVNDLLDASRLQAGQLRLERSPVDLGDAVREVLGALRPLAQQRQIETRQELPANLPLVSADDLRLMQILLNLMGNAIKFTQPGGEVTIQAVVREPMVQVTVHDNGPGISPEDQRVIFDLFRRGSAHERSGGSGLGLALAKQLVELHGGEIWVESEPGHGSSFHFTLPIHRGDAL